MSFRIGYSFIKNVKCILKIKQPYDDHLFQIQNINKRKKSENFFSILSDNTNITSYAVFICIMINLF